ELREDATLLCIGNAHTFVSDGDANSRPVRLESHLYDASVRRVLDRVGEQIAQYLFDAVALTQDRHGPVGKLDLQGVCLALRRVELDFVAQERVEIERFERQCKAAVLD